MSLRVVKPEHDPLSVDELQTLGSALVSKARESAIDAMALSGVSEFLMRDKRSLNMVDIRRWHAKAKRAGEAWAKVEAATAELIAEAKRTSRRREEHE